MQAFGTTDRIGIMKSESPDSGDAQSEKVTSLRDSDIVSSRAYGRRGLL